MSRFQKFEDSFQTAIKTIERFLDTEDREGINVLAKWIMETDANPYAYLPNEWAGGIDNAEMFASLLHYIHYAVYDDGEIKFVTVNNEPRIIFVWPEDDEMLHKYALSETEQDIAKRSGNVYDIKVIDISPREFGALYDEYQKKDLMRCFSMDVGCHGLEFARQSYSKYKCFSEEWVDACAAEIKKWQRFYDAGSKLWKNK